MSGKITYHIGRIFLGLMLIAMGYFIFTSGHQQFDKYLHAIRKILIPNSQGSSKVPMIEVTYEKLNQYLVKADGILFVLSGLLVMSNSKGTGGFAMFVAVLFILLTKDNPFLTNSKSLQREQYQRTIDCLKHLSLVGISFLLMGGGRRTSRDEIEEGIPVKK